MSSITTLQTVKENLNILSTFKENERIGIAGKQIRRYEAPDRFFAESETTLGQMVHRVGTLVLKIIQAIGRYFAGETTERELNSLEEMVGRVTDLCKVIQEGAKDKNEEAPSLYRELNSLKEVHLSLHKLLDSDGWKNYRATLEKGGASLIADSGEVRAGHCHQFDEIAKRLQEELSKSVAEAIETLQNDFYGDDVKKTEEAFRRYATATSSEEGENYLSIVAVKDVMGGIFGKNTFEKALHRTNLGERSAITEKELQIATTHLLTNLTMEDLKEIYENKRSELLPLSERFTPSNQPFESLGEEQLCRLMGELVSFGKRSIPLEKTSPHYAQLSRDEALLRCYSLLIYYDRQATNLPIAEEVRKYGYTEYLTRYIAYALFANDEAKFTDGVLIPSFDEEGKLVLKKANVIVSEKGLHCLTLEPAVVNEGEKTELQVLFRGTYCRDSMKRDLPLFEGGIRGVFDGPGRHSFAAKREAIDGGIEKAIEKLYSKSGQKVTPQFLGHSLGSADAQRAQASFVEMASKKPSLSEKIEKCHLFAYNAPSIEPDIAYEFIENLGTVSFDCIERFFDADNDPVQQCGPTRLGYVKKKQKEPGNLKVTTLRFNRKIEEKEKMLSAKMFKRVALQITRAMNQHTAPFFSSIEEPYTPSELAGKKNHTFIDRVTTNNGDDRMIRYGKDLNFITHFSSPEDIKRSLMMPVANVAKKIDRLLKKPFSSRSEKKPKPSTALLLTAK